MAQNKENDLYVCTMLCTEGCAEFAKKELEQKFKVKTFPFKKNTDKNTDEHYIDCVEFQANKEQLISICYLSQTAERIIINIFNEEFSEIEDIPLLMQEKLLELKNKSPFSEIKGSFKIECERTGIHDFNSVEVEQLCNESIKQMYQENLKTDLKKPETTFFIKIKDQKVIAGLDVTGQNLGKRHYLIFNNHNSLRGSTAASLLYFSDYEPKKLLLDPFSLSGVICIEASALASNMSHHFYSKDFQVPEYIMKKEELQKIIHELNKKQNHDKKNIFSLDASFSNVAAQKKNARVAGLEKTMNFGRTDAKNLDLKNFGTEEGIDMVCSMIIEPSSKVNENIVKNIYLELFETAKYFLKKQGTINLILRNPELLEQTAQEKGFSTKEKKEVWQGKQKLYFVKLLKTKN